jgi:hypothetical protein
MQDFLFARFPEKTLQMQSSVPESFDLRSASMRMAFCRFHPETGKPTIHQIL